jgi:hypothetical protein
VRLWDGRTDQGRAAGSGTYFTELTIAGRRTNQRVLVVR